MCVLLAQEFLLSLTVVVVVVVGKTTTAVRRFNVGKRQRGRPRWGRAGGKSENIRLNQMQIERFAVGNFQFSSPVCQTGPPLPRRRYCLGSDTGKTNLELIFCRRVSFRFDSIRSVARSVRCEFRQKWVAPAWVSSFPLPVGRIHTFVCSFVRSFVRVDVLLIIFCPDARCLIITRLLQLPRYRTFTLTRIEPHTNFLSLLKNG